MSLFGFTINRMDNYGVKFDPRKAVTSGAFARDTWVTRYQLGFYIDDWDGGTVIDGKLYPARKDYFTCAKPGQTWRRKLPYRYYFLHISTDDPQLKEALDALPTYAHNPDIPKIIELFQKTFKRDRGSGLVSNLELYGNVSCILSLLLRKYPDATPVAPVTTVRRHEDALIAADKYLRTHLDEDVDLKKLAAPSNLHPTYFHKLYTAAYGHTPTENLMIYRIRAAWGHLRDDNMPIAEIARILGFSSQSFFNRKFKEITLQTPSQYRQSLRKRRAATKKENP